PMAIDNLPADISAIALHPRARELAVGMHDNSVEIYDLDSGTKLTRLTGHSGSIAALEFDATGSRLVSADLAGTIKSWKPNHGSEWPCTSTVHTRIAMSKVAILPDQGLTAGVHNEHVQVFELESGREVSHFDLSDRSYNFRQLTMNQSGNLLAITTGAGLGVWNLEDGQLRHLAPPELSWAYQATFNSDSTLLACASEEGLFVLDLPSYQRRATLRSDTLVRVAFQPNGEHIAFASNSKRIR